MSEQIYPVAVHEPQECWFQAEWFDREAYERLEEEVEQTMASQFSEVFAQDPRILELDELDGRCFTASPWNSYGESCCIRDNVSLEQALQETRAASLKELYRLFNKEYDQQRKNTEEHHQGRERFHTVLESLILEHIPAFIAQYPDLEVQHATITRQKGDFLGHVAFHFLFIVQEACEAIWNSEPPPEQG